MISVRVRIKKRVSTLVELFYKYMHQHVHVLEGNHCLAGCGEIDLSPQIPASIICKSAFSDQVGLGLLVYPTTSE